ncbi:MAG: hypothetical protein AAF721_09105 [Myxococcota bacterium]
MTPLEEAVRKTLGWARRVLLFFAGVGLVLGVVLGVVASGAGGWIAAAASLAFAATFGWLAWAAPHRNPVVKEVSRSKAALTRVVLAPSAVVHAPPEKAAEVVQGMDFSVRYELDGAPVAGEYRLRRGDAAEFVRLLRAHDASLAIDLEDHAGAVVPYSPDAVSLPNHGL